MSTVTPPGFRYLLPFILLAAILGCALLGENATQVMRYDRTAILHGEVWRLLTGHLVHLGWSHTLMNALAAALIFALFGRGIHPLGWLLTGVVTALVISLGFLLLEPEVDWYVGLSGVLHGFITMVAIILLMRGQGLAGLLLVLLFAKLAWEQIYGPLPGSEDSAGGPVLTIAHLYGAVGGVVSSLCIGGCLRRDGRVKQ